MFEKPTYEIKRQVGVISEKSGGWKRQLKIVVWNGGEAKYDIRDWSSDETKMGRGITLKEEEARTLYELLKGEFEK